MAKRLNPEWVRIDGRIKYIRAMFKGRRNLVGNADVLRAELRTLLAMRKTTPYLLHPIKPRLSYVRYADDFVIVLRNILKADAEVLKAKVTQWVENNLRLVLSAEKTAITHITDGFVFLGYKFMAKQGNTGSQPRVKLVIPSESAQRKIDEIKLLCRHYGTPEIDVIRRINSMLWGWMTYYSCATAPSRTWYYVLGQVWSIYGSYVSRKHGCHIGAACKRWMTRYPATLRNPKGGQKTWVAETRRNGAVHREYLLCYTPPKRSLRDVACRIYNKRSERFPLIKGPSQC